jgi:hypothetical protein
VSESVKWAELTERERDQLIHEKVMGHSPDEKCQREFVPMNPEPDGLYCPGCGAECGWGDLPITDEDHEKPIPPHYTTFMGAAWQVAEQYRLVIRPDLFHGWWAGEFKSVYLDGVKVEYRNPVRHNEAPMAICLAALRACNIEVV